jgi:hypothetical protein
MQGRSGIWEVWGGTLFHHIAIRRLPAFVHQMNIQTISILILVVFILCLFILRDNGSSLVTT